MATEDTEKTENQILADAMREQRDQEEGVYRGRTYAALGLQALKDGLKLYSDKKDAEKRAALARRQAQEVQEKLDDKVQVDFDMAASQQAVEQFGRNLASLIAQNPTQAAGAIQSLGRAKRQLMDEAAIDAETARMKGQAEKDVALIPLKQEAERAELEAELSKPGTMEALGALKDVAGTGLAASRPRTAQRRAEDKATRSGKRAQNIAARIGKRERAGKDASGLRDRFERVQTRGQKAARTANTIREQNIREARERVGLGDADLSKMKQFGADKIGLTSSANELITGRKSPPPLLPGGVDTKVTGTDLSEVDDALRALRTEGGNPNAKYKLPHKRRRKA